MTLVIMMNHYVCILSLSLYLSLSIQFNMCFIGMTIVTMDYQSIAYSKYIYKKI